MRRWSILGVFAAVLLAITAFVPFGSSSRQASAQTKTASGQSFEAKLWDYLRRVHYRNWTPAAGQGADHYPGKSPHGAYLKMYLNRVAAADTKNLPHGSIIIKENFDKKKKLAAITVMYRAIKGYDPEHNDWYWVKFNPDGTVATTPADKGSKPIAGRFKSCIDCHSGAKGGDYYFANDK